MTLAADPVLLQDYRARGQDLVAALRGLAREVGEVAGPSGADLVALLVRLADAEDATDRWVGAVGDSLVAADRGTLLPARPLPMPTISLRSRYRAALRSIRREIERSTDDHRRAVLRSLLEPDPRTHRPRQFLAFDPGGDGQVVEVLGDLSSAAAVAVVVPGMGESLENFERRARRRARRLRDAATRAAGDHRGVAVVAWLGYDAPDALDDHLTAFREVLSDSSARSGGRNLAAMVRTLELRPDQRLTYVGHSYGSTTVAAAVLAGARPDAVVAVGSPGMLVGHTSEFHAPGTEFWAMAAPDDAVAKLGWFGADPNRRGHGFAALGAAGPGHGSYFDPRSRSLANLAAVVVGQRHQ